jgi:hypothetical protein
MIVGALKSKKPDLAGVWEEIRKSLTQFEA